MKQRDLNYLSMATTTLKVVNNNTAVWQKSKPFARQVTAIETAYAATGASQQSGATVTTGITSDKVAAADDAIRKAVLLSGLTKAYAAEVDDHTLYEQMNVSFSMLDKLPDEALAPRLTDLLTRMQTLGDPLAEYGVTKDKVAGLQKAIAAFADLKGTPRMAIVERKGSNESIPDLLRTMRKAFAILDNLIQQFEDDNPDFVKAYANARLIVVKGVQHGQVAAPEPAK